MSTKEKLKEKLLSGKMLKFRELQHLLLIYDFNLERISGDHFIYFREDIDTTVDIQPEQNGDSKKYQLKQIGKVFRKHNL